MFRRKRKEEEPVDKNKELFEERVQEFLKDLYPDNPVKLYLHQISEAVYRVQSVTSEFTKVYNHITPYDMYEGLVLKRRDGKLENGSSQKNNTRTQMKCRKPTKNYSF